MTYLFLKLTIAQKIINESFINSTQFIYRRNILFPYFSLCREACLMTRGNLINTSFKFLSYFLKPNWNYIEMLHVYAADQLGRENDMFWVVSDELYIV